MCSCVCTTSDSVNSHSDWVPSSKEPSHCQSRFQAILHHSFILFLHSALALLIKLQEVGKSQEKSRKTFQGRQSKRTNVSKCKANCFNLISQFLPLLVIENELALTAFFLTHFLNICEKCFIGRKKNKQQNMIHFCKPFPLEPRLWTKRV